MSESHREDFDPWKKSLSSGSGSGADPTQPTCPKSQKKESFGVSPPLRLSEKFKADVHLLSGNSHTDDRSRGATCPS